MQKTQKERIIPFSQSAAETKNLFILSIFILIPIVQTAVCSVFKSFWIFCSQSSSAHKIHVVASAVKEHLPEYMTTMNTDLGTLSGGVCESLTPITIAIQPYYHGGPGE